MAVLNIDVETRSTLDLTRVGAEKYARHSSTRVLCASFSIDNGPVTQWRAWAGQPMPAELAAALDDPDTEIHAWNAAFERQILKHVLKRDLPPSRFRCTQARARSMALPGKLELCAKALAMPIQKADSRVMMKWCKPLPSGGWADDPQEYSSLCGYCDVDVLTEQGLGGLLRHLSPEEQRDWCITEYVNQNGIPIDIQLVQAAQRYAADEMQEIKQRLSDITHGVVTSPKQFQRLKEWLAPEIEVDSLDAAVREGLLDDPSVQGDIREVIQLVDDGGRASTAKFAAMEGRADSMGRVHGAYIFNGAGQTGRWSSTGAQLHNFIRDKLDNTEDVVDAILRGASKDELIKIAQYSKDYTGARNILTILSRLLRPSLVAPDGKTFVWGDWKAIEARVLPWLSLENSASQLLDLFADNQDVYKHQASGMFGVRVEEVSDGQRQRGKVAILSLGYGGGAGALIAMARNYGLIIDEETAEMYKRTWRQTNPWAQRFWNALEAAIYNAVRNPGAVFSAGRVRYLSTEAVLWCLLPCGRMLAYPFPKIETRPGRFGPSDQVTCIKGAWAPKKGMNYWPRMSLWGGLAAENCLAADTEVLTDSGWKHIVDVTRQERVWDGVEWVEHQGLIHQGRKPVIDFSGVLMTPDHKLLTETGWVTANEATKAGARFNWSEVRTPDRVEICRESGKLRALVDALRMRIQSYLGRQGSNTRQDTQLWVPSRRVDKDTSNDTRYVETSGFCGVAFDVRSLPLTHTPSVEELWRTWNSGLQKVENIPGFLERYGPYVFEGFDFREGQQFRRIQSVKLPVGNLQNSSTQHPQQSDNKNSERRDASLRGGRNEWRESDNLGLPLRSQLAGEQTVQSANVYDLLNAGPRHRFTIRASGKLFIVSNCTQGVAASLLRWSQRELADNGWLDCLVGHTHDENLLEVDDAEVATAREVLSDIMVGGPGWAAGLPLAVDMMSGAVYGK